MAELDLARIKRNVKKMASMGAPEADIDGYIASEGTTIDAIRNFKFSTGKPSVPFYARDEQGNEIALNAEEYQRERTKQLEQQAREEEAFAETRTPGARLKDTATFISSLPVRMATHGEYGAGDVVGLVAPETGQELTQSEVNFARANEPGLKLAADAGDVLLGIPQLSSMGAVPGQMLRTSAAATRQLPKLTKRVMTETRGSGPIPGGSAMPPPPTPPSPINTAARMPNRGEVFEAAGRLEKGLSTPEGAIKIDIPEMVAGRNYKQTIAAGLRSVPIAGDPIESAFTKGLQQLETAKGAVGKTLGSVVGEELAGEGIKSNVLKWIERGSKEAMNELYAPAKKLINPEIKTPLRSTGRIAQKFYDDMAESTGTAELAAVNKLEEAVTRPEGLTVRGLQKLTQEIGDHLDEAAVQKSPSERAFRRAYGALKNDLREAVRKSGGTDAVRLWNRADRQAQSIILKRKRLAKYVGVNENALSSEKVFGAVRRLGKEEGGDARSLYEIMDIIGPKARGDFAAELIDRMGRNPKTELFSHDRFLTDYGKYSAQAKNLIFKEAKPHLDDIATISKKMGQLSAKFNRSNTGIVNAVLKMILNPKGTLAVLNAATAGVNPASVATIGLQAGAIGGARSLAWTLAKPANAKQATNVMKALYNLERASNYGFKTVAKREQEFSSAVRSFSLAVAEQTGANADDIAREFMQRVNELRTKPE